jgi:hypothetical protein
MLRQLFESGRIFRAEFMGRRARSNKTGREGIIIGGNIRTRSDQGSIGGDFELQTAEGVERYLSIGDLVFLDVDDAGKRLPSPFKQLTNGKYNAP